MERKIFEKLGEGIGFIAMFFIFSTILFFLLEILDKLPADFGYFHVVFLSISIVLLGTLIRMVLK